MSQFTNHVLFLLWFEKTTVVCTVISNFHSWQQEQHAVFKPLPKVIKRQQVDMGVNNCRILRHVVYHMRHVA